MKTKLLLSVFLACSTILCFAQLPAGTSSVDITVDDKLQGFHIVFTSDLDAFNDAFNANDFTTDPAVDEDEKVLLITTNSHAQIDEWWTLGSLQYYDQSGGAAYTTFLIQGGVLSFVIETPVQLGYWVKFDQEIWAPGFQAIETGDTIRTLNEPVKITIDMAALATQLGVSVTSEDFSVLYLYFYSADGSEAVAKLHSVGYGTLEGNVTTDISLITTDESIDLLSADIQSIRVYDISGKELEQAQSFSKITTQGKTVILVITYTDGSQKTTKISL